MVTLHVFAVLQRWNTYYFGVIVWNRAFTFFLNSIHFLYVTQGATTFRSSQENLQTDSWSDKTGSESSAVYATPSPRGSGNQLASMPTESGIK